MKYNLVIAWALTLAMIPLVVLGDSPPVPDFDASALPDTVGDYEGFNRRIFQEGRVFIAGQPSEEAVRALTDHGVTLVVNLRTPNEMDDRERVPFDEKALLEELGIAYEWLPQGGTDHPYEPATVEKFIAALESHEGNVLLHCTVGWRASHLWAAYLVEYYGFDVSEAYTRGAAMGIGTSPFEKYLGRELKFSD